MSPLTTPSAKQVEILYLGLAIIAKGSWNVGRGDLISVNDYARQTLQAAGLWDEDIFKIEDPGV